MVIIEFIVLFSAILYALQLIVLNIVFLSSDIIKNRADYFILLIPWFIILPVVILGKLLSLPKK